MSIVRTVLWGVIALPVAAAYAQPLPVQELGLLPGDLAVGAAVNSQQDHAVARGGDQYLVVWSDSRARSVGGSSPQSQSDIFGIRLDAAGNPIDPVPFAINAAMGEQRRPVVAWNGEAWLVMFVSQDPVGGYFADQVRGVRVSADGQVLDPTPILFPPSQFDPSTIGLQLAGLGGQWLVTRCVYHNDGYGTFLGGQRISSSGQLLDSAPIMLSDWVYGPTKTLVAGNEYLVVGPDWNSAATIKARRVSASLTPIGASFNVPSMNLATSGGEYYVVWLSNFTNLVGSRMTLTGILLNPAGTLITGEYSQYHSAVVAHDDTNWWVQWGAADQWGTVRISPAGAVLDPNGGVQLPIVIGGTINQVYSPVIVPRAGGGVMSIWYDSRPAQGNDTNVSMMPISAANVPGDEAVLSTSSANQRLPDFAGGPGGVSGRSAVVYVSEFANDDRVLVSFLDSKGMPMPGEPIVVAQGPTIDKAAIAWNGSVYMVTWDEGSSGLTPVQIKARRVHADGTFPDAEPISVMPGYAPDIEALGEDFLIGCSRYAQNPQFIDAWRRRISGATGQFLDAAPVLNGTGYVSNVRVRSDGTSWIMLYQSNWSHNSANVDAVMNFISASGVQTPPSNPTPYAGGTGTPDIACNGAAGAEGKYLIVWRNNTLASANNSIAGRIMNADRTFATGAFTISDAPGRQLSPVVGWDGSTFVVAWDDQRNQDAFFDHRTDIYAARITTAGQVLDPNGIAVIRDADAEATASILATSGMSLVASARFMLAPPLDSYRIGITRLGTPPCIADFNGDSGVDDLDITAFFTAFELGDPGADVNGDAGIDDLDISEFFASFEQGC